MKKAAIIALLLALVVFLVACSNDSSASSETELFEAANALMDEGKYEQAIAIYQSIESYQKISEKIAEAESHLLESAPPESVETETQPIESTLPEDPNAFLYQKWIDLNDDPVKQYPQVLTFLENGTVYDKEGYQKDHEQILPYAWESGDITVINSHQVVVMRLHPEEINGVIHLVGSYNEHDYDFVPEVNYDSLKQG